MTPEDVTRLPLPQGLPQLRAGLASMLEQGQDPSPVLETLAARNPLALADVVVGPRGLKGPGMARAALRVIEPLESVVSPSALYRRLIQLAGSARTEVLTMAVRRHTTQRWVMQLSASTEGELAGLIHLTHAPAEHLSSLCTAYAQAGAVDGLIAASRVLRDDMPVLALLRAGNLPGAARAASALLEITPQVPVVERMAAIWGPDLAPMLLALIESAPGATALRRLCDYTDGYPEAVDALAALSIYPEAAEPDQAAVSDAGLPPKDSSL